MERKGLGKRINEVRKDRGFTADKLSELCNINATYLRQIEGGVKMPSLPVFIDICNSLRISPDYLLQDELPGSDAVIGNIIASVKKQGSYQYDRYLTIIKALAEISDKL